MSAGGSPLPEDTRAQSAEDVTRQTPPPLFKPGDTLPNLEMWTLQRRLGGGGFGEVWLANHPSKGNAAVKFCTDPAARHKLVNHEKVVVARVMKYCGDHPNVVPLLECNLSGDIPWLMYEYVEGGTLAEAVESWQHLTPPRRLAKAVLTLHAIASALGTFHRLHPPLVHRDMKPQNILMAGPIPRITDFGIGGAAAEATQSDEPGSGLAVRLPTVIQTAGSSKYAPQEQFLGSPPNPRDDVYALGVIAYQMMVADLRATPGDDIGQELRALRIPTELVALITGSLAMDPQRRPKDATEWERKLEALLRRKTAGRSAVAASALPPPGQADRTEVAEALGDSQVMSASVQLLSVRARGRWYARTAGQMSGDWKLVTTTPAEVRLSGNEVYRFSIHSAATAADVAAVGRLAGLTSIRYLNLSFCDGVTDAGLEPLREFRGLRQLYLRGCRHITDAGLRHLHALTGLHTLELTECPGLTPDGIAALRDALPQCNVVG
jgi:tRNA A-37 threonylcarbamoyl transferase component Bud32